MNPKQFPVQGAGLGLRRALLGPLRDIEGPAPDFLEVAPENWIGVGGKLGHQFRHYSEQYPLLVHGLSLSVGAPEPLDETYIARLRRFLDEHDAALYSDHLSYCSEHGHLYDLMPLPFLPETVEWVGDRIARVQDLLGRQIAVENISYYADPGSEMSELEFIKAVLERADCKFLLDVNNIHVNSVNHGYDPVEFLNGLPAERVAYIHVAGHHHEAEDLIVDTHGAAVADSVWGLLAKAYDRLGPVPTLLERDFNFPPLPELLAEVETIRKLQPRPLAA
ncbi:MAG: DUF692 domain-containing protein [Pseudomonadota bacterium]